ncbi:MAG: hypothetical protein IMY71_08080 [Bacteroidetes bacterium]|nr:hypothetical protein [Bacteroidota bacterium]
MSSIDDVKRIKKKYEKKLMRKKGVLGCAVGYKHVAGKKTDQICIVYYVNKKKPEDQLSKSDMVPRFIEGIPTDIIESGEIRAL